MDDRNPLDDVADSGDEAADRLVASLLGDATVWADAPAGLEDSIVAAIAAEADRPALDVPPTISQPPPATVSSVARVSKERSIVASVDDGGPADVFELSDRRRRRRAALGGLAAAAAITAIVAVGVIVAGRSGDEADFELALAPTDLAPGAAAVAEIDTTPAGVRIVLDVSGLPPAEPGTYYQAWVRNDAGGVSAGTFHLRGGDDEIELWVGVPIEDYPLVTVTVQDEDGGPASSGQVVLAGRLDLP